MFLSRILGPYKGLPREIYVLFAAAVVNGLGNFVWPLLALFLTGKMGMSNAQAGAFITWSMMLYVPASMVGGKLTDHVGRRAVFLGSRALSAMVLVPCAFLGSSPVVPWLLLAMSFFVNMAEPAMNAMEADLTNSRNRQTAFSLLYLGMNLGFSVGFTLAGLLYRHHLAWIFLGDALTTILSLVLVARYIPETLPRETAIQEGKVELSASERPEEGGLWAVLLKRPTLVAFSLILTVYAFVYAQSGFSLPLQLREAFGVRGPEVYGLLMSVNALGVVALTPLVVSLSARYLPTRNLGIAGLLYAAGFGMVYMASNLPLMVVSTVIWTLGEILGAVNNGAYIANNTPVSHRGRFNSVIQIISNAGRAASPWLVGIFIDQAGVPAVWPLCFVLAAAGAVLMFGLGRRSNQPAEDAA